MQVICRQYGKPARCDTHRLWPPSALACERGPGRIGRSCAGGCRGRPEAAVALQWRTTGEPRGVAIGPGGRARATGLVLMLARHAHAHAHASRCPKGNTHRLCRRLVLVRLEEIRGQARQPPPIASEMMPPRESWSVRRPLGNQDRHQQPREDVRTSCWP